MVVPGAKVSVPEPVPESALPQPPVGTEKLTDTGLAETALSVTCRLSVPDDSPITVFAGAKI